MSTALDVHRLAAFTDDPLGGNPAGVVLLDAPLDEAAMQQTAADVGYSETAFLSPHDGGGWDVRYFTPQAEVPFCGHATVAAGALLARTDGPGTRSFHTPAGEVVVESDVADGLGTATLTSVDPRVEAVPDGLVGDVLAAFGWESRHLAPSVEPAVAFGGSRHLLLPVRSRAVLGSLDYDYDTLRDLTAPLGLVTVAVLWRQDDLTWHARNVAPAVGLVEDPATGSAAAAFGGWLRTTGLVSPPADVVVHQGVDLGRPSRLDVHVPRAGGIRVAGQVVDIPDHLA